MGKNRTQVEQFKERVVENLQSLVEGGDFGQFIDLKDVDYNLNKTKISRYPALVLSLATMTSEVIDNATLIRTWSFPVGIYMRRDQFKTSAPVESHIEVLADKFDQDFTLNNLAIDIVAVQPDGEISSDKNYVNIPVTIMIRTQRNYA